MSGFVQLEGPITIGSTDYSDVIANAIIRRRANLTTRRPTFGNARSVSKKGSLIEEFEFEIENEIVAAGLWKELWDALDTDTGELAVTARMKPGAVAPDNTEFQFNIIAVGVEVGGTPGEQNYQRWVCPITEDGITEDIAP